MTTPEKHLDVFVPAGPGRSNPAGQWQKTLCTILIVFWLVSACASQPGPNVTSAPTFLPSLAPPTELVSPTLQPTPTDQSFVLPGGRLLLAVGPASGGKYPDTDVDLFQQYRWLELPGMTISPHPLLTGEYPIQDDFVFVTLSPNRLHLAFVRDTWSKIQTGGKTFDAVISHSMLLADPEGDAALPIGQPITEGGINRVMGCGDEPSWSADSRFFAFARTPDWTSAEQEHHLYVYEVATGRLNTVTIHSQQGLGAFALSPDGAQIAVTEIESTPEFGLNLHLLNADGSNDRVLVRGWITSNLVWHPDGTRIFFKNDRVDGRTNPGIYSVDVATGDTTLLTAVSESAWCLVLSPDESLLTYSDERGIMAVNPEGGEPQLFLQACNVRFVSRRVWSPDNQYVAFVGGPIPDQQIFIMDRAGNCEALEYHEDQMLPWDLIGWLP